MKYFQFNFYPLILGSVTIYKFLKQKRKKGVQMKKVITALLFVSMTMAQGWHESFDTDATPSGEGIFTCDYTWAWWAGWGNAEISDGSLTLWATDDPFGEVTCWIQIDESLNTETVITPEDFTMYVKMKFESPEPDLEGGGDGLHVVVAASETFLSDINLYTAVTSPTGIAGSFHFATGAYGGPVEGPGAEYDTWFWMKVQAIGNDVSIWTFADGSSPSEDAQWTFGTDEVDAPLASLIMAFTGDHADATVSLDDVYYNMEPELGVDDYVATPGQYHLAQNYPNPFNPETNIQFTVPNNDQVRLTVLDILGNEVATLVDANIQSGTHTVSWNASHMPSGIYFYHIEATGFNQTRKLTLIK